jgi:PAS domain-containing protein
MDMPSALELVERSSEPACAIDGAQRIVAWNQNAAALWGVTTDAAIGQRCYALFSIRTASDLQLCGPNCAAAVCFQPRPALQSQLCDDCRAVRRNSLHPREQHRLAGADAGGRAEGRPILQPSGGSGVSGM